MLLPSLNIPTFRFMLSQNFFIFDKKYLRIVIPSRKKLHVMIDGFRDKYSNIIFQSLLTTINMIILNNSSLLVELKPPMIDFHRWF